MPSLVRNLIPNFLRHPPQAFSGARPQHQMLSGIHQTVFLNQWGHPDIRLGLDRMEGFFEFDSLFLKEASAEETLYSVWIYESKDKILFFKRGRLISHFKWSNFRHRWKGQKNRIDLKTLSNPSPSKSKTLSLLS